MKKSMMWLALVLVFVAFKPAHAAEEAKGLAPGWLSLDSSVGLLDKKIEEGKGAIEKALLGISISGFFDASYTWSSNRAGSISGRYFHKDHNDVVFNDFNLTIDKPEKDWGVGFHIVGDFGRTGELLREATLWNKKLQKQPSAELREAFLTFTIPIGEGLQVKGGKFVTLLGAEILPTPGARNPNISDSFMFLFSIPFTHTGALFTYPVLKSLSISAGPVTGWDNPHDNNSRPSFLGGLNFTPTDAFAFASSVIAGPEQRHNNGRTRFVISNVATIKPISPLTLILNYDYGHEEKASLGGTRDATWQGVTAIASYDWTDRFTTALRGEWFNDRDGARLGGDFFGTHANVTVGEVTLTGAYKFTKMLMGRAEVRQDWSDRRIYQRGSSNADKNQTTLAVQLIYGF